jgi:hypothetical protein
VALPLPDPSEAKSPRGKKVMETKLAAALQNRDIVSRLWTSGKGHTGDGSAWEAYNGLVEAVDHDETAFPTRRGSRTEALMIGTLGDIKDRVGEALMAYATRV